MDVINLVIGFNLGLLSTPHCLAMCGGIITALGMAGAGNRGVQNRIVLVAAYNLGRITSYTVAGGIAGLAGGRLAFVLMPAAGHDVLRMIAAVMLVLIGLHLCGWLYGSRLLESLGMRLWGLLQPLVRRVSTVPGLTGALIAGVLWGWLPCGLVYSVLLWSLASGDAVSGALLLFAFGLGTLPGMVTAGFLGQGLFNLLRQPLLRTAGGLIIISLGILSLLFDPSPHLHQHH